MNKISRDKQTVAEQEAEGSDLDLALPEVLFSMYWIGKHPFRFMFKSIINFMVGHVVTMG